MKTKVINTENGEFINDFATLELANEFIASEKLEDAKLEYIAVPVQYVICDNTENTGKPYIAEDLSNTGTSEGAWIFNTEKEAQNQINNAGWEWAYVEEI